MLPQISYSENGMRSLQNNIMHACNPSKDFLDTKVGYWNRNPRKHFYPVYGVVQLCFALRI